jgi:HK97 family phage prohead protease
MRFAGYAAVFDRPDRGGDVVRAGAFARSLGRGAAAAVPLLWQHEAGRPIGRIEYLKEDKRGLRVIARVADRRAAALLQEGAVGGLSFGYRVREAKGPSTGSGQAGLRELTDLELVEVSLVTFPMQPKARVHAVERAPVPLAAPQAADQAIHGSDSAARISSRETGRGGIR